MATSLVIAKRPSFPAVSSNCDTIGERPLPVLGGHRDGVEVARGPEVGEVVAADAAPVGRVRERGDLGTRDPGSAAGRALRSVHARDGDPGVREAGAVELFHQPAERLIGDLRHQE